MCVCVCVCVCVFVLGGGGEGGGCCIDQNTSYSDKNYSFDHLLLTVVIVIRYFNFFALDDIDYISKQNPLLYHTKLVINLTVSFQN